MYFYIANFLRLCYTICMATTEEHLRTHGSKATSGRVELFEVLEKSKIPLSIPEIMKNMGKKVNQTTVYRALESLVEAGMVYRVDLGHSHAHYELCGENNHHHHIVCKQCGKIEDVAVCESKELEKTVLKKSTSFSVIKSHALEFFGLCKQCVKN